MTEDAINEEPVEISAGERKDLLDLVSEQQARRATANTPISAIPKILLPYQIRWHADLSVVRLAEKSRRIGWSWGALAAEGALEAARPKGKGMDQFYMGYNQSMAAENIGDVVFFARAYGFAVSEIDVRRHVERLVQIDESGRVLSESKRDITTYKVQFASGHIYEALSSNPHNWRGRQGHARIDEAAFHKNLGEVVKAALAFRLWGGRIDIVSTHNGEDNPFNAWVKEIQAGKLGWSLHRVTFDDALRDGFYQRICLVTGKSWSPEAEAEFRAAAFADYPDQTDANEELLCIPKRGSGFYFSRLLIEQCQEPGIPVIRWERSEEFVLDEARLDVTDAWLAENIIPILDNLPGQRSVYGQDFGRDGDLSVIAVLQEDAPGHWRTAFHVELRRIPFDVQARIRDAILDRLPLLHAAWFDARGNGQSHAEGAQQKYGFLVQCLKATPEWYATSFPKYHAAFEDRAITVPAGEDFISDHRLIELKNGNPRMGDGHNIGSDRKRRHGDSAIAYLLAWMAAMGNIQPPAGEQIDEAKGDIQLPEAMRGRRLFRSWAA